MLATCLFIAICSVAAYAAILLGLPLPYLLGPLIASAFLSLFAKDKLPKDLKYLNGLRFVCIAVIGLLIGAQVSPELFRDLPQLALSVVALVVFVFTSIAYNFAVFSKLGKYDNATAFYSSMPGGLYESIAIGEEAGANPARLILQQFLRVITVVTLVPIGLSLWLGEPVGSADGMTLAKADVPWHALPVALVAILVGIAIGRFLRFPAGQLTGPMAVGAALSLSGLIAVDIPQWLVNLSLIIVGTALGTRFHGLSRSLVAQGFGLALLSVAGMLGFAAVLAWVLTLTTGQPFDMLLVSFAPGGVTEMTLVALSLSGSPAIVTLHHVCRIMITVVVLTASAKWVRYRL